MFNFIDIYSFIHETGCVGRDAIALLFPGVNNANKKITQIFVPNFILVWASEIFE
jgi:hypothetical protein